MATVRTKRYKKLSVPVLVQEIVLAAGSDGISQNDVCSKLESVLNEKYDNGEISRKTRDLVLEYLYDEVDNALIVLCEVKDKKNVRFVKIYDRKKRHYLFVAKHHLYAVTSKSKDEPERIVEECSHYCRCLCHSGRRIMHIKACCRKCSLCNKMISDDRALEEHAGLCHNKTRKEVFGF